MIDILIVVVSFITKINKKTVFFSLLSFFIFIECFLLLVLKTYSFLQLNQTNNKQIILLSNKKVIVVGYGYGCNRNSIFKT